MNFVAHPMLPSKMSKSQEKKSTFLQKYFQQNRHFSKKYRFFEKIKYISDSGGYSCHFDYYLPV